MAIPDGGAVVGDGGVDQGPVAIPEGGAVDANAESIGGHAQCPGLTFTVMTIFDGMISLSSCACLLGAGLELHKWEENVIPMMSSGCQHAGNLHSFFPVLWNSLGANKLATSTYSGCQCAGNHACYSDFPL